jgi:hypothetical protein
MEAIQHAADREDDGVKLEVMGMDRQEEERKKKEALKKSFERSLAGASVGKAGE